MTAAQSNAEPAVSAPLGEDTAVSQNADLNNSRSEAMIPTEARPDASLSLPPWSDEALAKIREQNKSKNVVCIVGFAPTTRHLALYDDPEVEIFSLNEAHRHKSGYLKRWTRWFQLHEQFDYTKQNSQATKDHWEWLQQPHDFPIYLQEVDPRVPASVKYPLEEITQTVLGRTKQWTEGGDEVVKRYFTSSFAYQAALVAYEKATGIKDWNRVIVVGYEMATSTEYCLAPHMRILTSDLRWVPVGELTEGENIVAFDETVQTGSKKRQWRAADVLALGRTRLPCVRITLEDGTVLECSKEHRWLVNTSHNREWLESDRLSAQPKRQSNLIRLTKTWDEDVSRDAGYLAGVFDGEGWYGHTKRRFAAGFMNRLGFAQKDNELREAACKALADRGYDWNESMSVASLGCIQHELRGGIPEKLRLLGSLRPPRLLSKFDPARLGYINGSDYPKVVSVEDIGEQEVVQLKTSTGTCIVEGIASHNSYQKGSTEWWMGKLDGMGIEVIVPPKCRLLHGSLYGYEISRVFTRDMLVKLLDGERKKERDQIRKTATLSGRREAIEELLKETMEAMDKPLSEEHLMDLEVRNLELRPRARDAFQKEIESVRDINVQFGRSEELADLIAYTDNAKSQVLSGGEEAPVVNRQLLEFRLKSIHDAENQWIQKVLIRRGQRTAIQDLYKTAKAEQQAEYQQHGSKIFKKELDESSMANIIVGRRELAIELIRHLDNIDTDDKVIRALMENDPIKKEEGK